jgi:hypothetical protein
VLQDVHNADFSEKGHQRKPTGLQQQAPWLLLSSSRRCMLITVVPKLPLLSEHPKKIFCQNPKVPGLMQGKALPPSLLLGAL